MFLNLNVTLYLYYSIMDELGLLEEAASILGMQTDFHSFIMSDSCEYHTNESCWLMLISHRTSI